MLLRIALYGFSLLALCAGAFMSVYWTMIVPGLERERLGRLKRAMYAAFESIDEPGVLAAQQRALRHEPFISLTVYRNDGQVLVTNHNPVLPPAAANDIEQLRPDPEQLPIDEGGRMLVGAFAPDGHRLGYAVFVWRSPPFRTTAALFALALMLAVLLVASFIFARRLASPLEQLSATVVAFGAGNTAARVQSTRNDEFGDLGRSFDKMADRVSAMLNTERELLANVSHELRTPMARMRTVLEIIEEGDAERARRGMTEIAEDLAELERLVEDVLTAVRLDLEAGRAPKEMPLLHTEVVDVRDVAEQAVSKIRSQSPARMIHLHPLRESANIEADKNLLRRAMDNLLDNARKYSPGTQPIDVRLHAIDNAVEFIVEDRGVGISESDRAMLFTPFFRGDRSRTRSAGGVGLGLVLTRRIAEAHHGTVDLAPRDGGGTVATMRLPLA